MEPIINKGITHSYEILERIEAGVVLFGHEVKAIKSGLLSLKGAYISTNAPAPAGRPELFLIKAHVSPYKQAGRLPGYDPERPRKLLVAKKELNSLIGKLQQKGLTIVPLKVYTTRNLIKLEIGLARGKKLFEKKEQLKERDIIRETRRMLKMNS
ncbi:SsrA-binding protein SmpB [Candidatus Falkowbacteria bacterium]|nr:SsrA-binding protein SmpB [Candidatus Falkowbacteria bacterium]